MESSRVRGLIENMTHFAPPTREVNGLMTKVYKMMTTPLKANTAVALG